MYTLQRSHKEEIDGVVVAVSRVLLTLLAPIMFDFLFACCLHYKFNTTMLLLVHVVDCSYKASFWAELALHIPISHRRPPQI